MEPGSRLPIRLPILTRSIVRSAVAPLAVFAFLTAAPSAPAVTVVSAFQHSAPESVGCSSVITRKELSCLHEPLVLLTPGPAGADTAWTSGNDRAEGVGQLVIGGASHFGLFDGRRALDVTKKLGGAGAFASIDQLGQAVGTTYRLGKPHPFFHDFRTGREATLSLPGRATGIANGPQVSLTLENGNGAIWNPALHSLLEFGPFTTTGINASGYVVGHLPNGDLGFAMPNGSGGVQMQDLGIQGSFNRVSLGNVATGYETQGKRIVPIEFDLGTWKLTQLELPPGYRVGTAIGMTDTGKVAFGNVFKSPGALDASHGVPVEWTSPGHPRPLPGLSLRIDGNRYGFVTFVGDTGISFGGLVGRRDVGFVAFPPPLAKLRGLEELALDLGGALKDQVAPEIFQLRQLLGEGKGKKACEKIRKLGPEFEDVAEFLEDQLGFFAAAQVAGFDDLSDGLFDFALEAGCPPTPLPLASPSPSQYPYDLQPLG